MVHNMDGA